MSEKEPELASILFSLPTDQDAYDAAIEGRHLREIIMSTYHYLSVLGQDNTVKVGAVRQFLHKLIKSKDLKCLKIKEDPKTEDDGDPLYNCIR